MKTLSKNGIITILGIIVIILLLIIVNTVNNKLSMLGIGFLRSKLISEDLKTSQCRPARARGPVNYGHWFRIGNQSFGRLIVCKWYQYNVMTLYQYNVMTLYTCKIRLVLHDVARQIKSVLLPVMMMRQSIRIKKSLLRSNGITCLRVAST